MVVSTGLSTAGSQASVYINVDASRFERFLTDVERTHLPFVTRIALTNTAKAARDEVRTEMQRVFNKPVPYTLRGVTFTKADKATPYAEVKIGGEAVGKLPPSAYLYPQVFGGPRSQKSFERQLLKKGGISPGSVVVPAERAPLNAYGNLSAGFINRVLADLQIETGFAGSTRARTTKSLKRNKNYRTARFFLIGEGHRWLEPGVYQRNPQTNAIWPVLFFVKEQVYKQRLDFHKVVREAAEKHFAPEFAAAFKRAMQTARR